MSPDEEEQQAATAPEEPKEEPTLTADFEQPKEEPEPAVIEIEEPEKSASDRYVDELMSLPVGERASLLPKIEKRMEEAGDAVPWKERQETEVAERTAAASADAERERRQQEVQGWQTNAQAARANVNWVVDDLAKRWEGRGVDDPAPRHDAAELDRQLDAYAQAEAGLRSHGAITEIGNAMTAALIDRGGAITEAEVRKLTTAPTRADKVRAYMDALAERVRKETEVELNADITKRIEDAVLAETAAIKAEAMREVQVAPEQTQTSSVGPKAPTYEEYDKATFEQRAEWKDQGIEAVAAL